MTILPFRFLTVMLVLIQIAGCSGSKSYDLENYIGLYALTEKECDVPAGAFDPCETTLFFEIVRGKFMGIDRSQFAYVFWSGNPKLNAHLQYESHPLRAVAAGTLDGDTLWINRDHGGVQEYLIVMDGSLRRYVATYTVAQGANERTTNYSLKPVRREDLAAFRLDYPIPEEKGSDSFSRSSE